MASVSLNLEGRRALVTGGSRGIGEACARRLAEAGARVVITSRSEAGENTAGTLRAAGHDVTHLICDIADEVAVKAMVLATRKLLGGLDCLVNNAGIMELGIVGMTTMDSVRRMFEANVTGLINLTQFAIRLLPPTGGSIVNLASIAGTQGIPGVAAYSGTKGAVISYTKAAAKELAPKNIRVNAIAPGFIDTAMARTLSDEWFQKRLESIAMKRIGRPEDIANAALFLCSDLSSYITGQIIGVDGGMVV
jgi:3-oxoacyl-[acyl-carrier protein] reductase